MCATKKLQEEKVVRFLIGVNDNFAVVSSNIFTKDQVPHMDKVFEMISHEESQRNAKRSPQV